MEGIRKLAVKRIAVKDCGKTYQDVEMLRVWELLIRLLNSVGLLNTHLVFPVRFVLFILIILILLISQIVSPPDKSRRRGYVLLSKAKE